MQTEPFQLPGMNPGLLKKKRLLPLISVKPSFLSRSFESMSHSWLPRSRSTMEWFLAVTHRTRISSVCLLLWPVHFIKSELVSSRIRLQAANTEKFPIQKRAFSGLCALPICRLFVSGVPVQWQLIVLMNTESA